MEELKPPTMLCCSFAVDSPPSYFCLLVIFPTKEQFFRNKNKKWCALLNYSYDWRYISNFKFIFRALLIFYYSLFPTELMVEIIWENYNIFYSYCMINLAKLCFYHPELKFTDSIPRMLPYSESYFVFLCSSSFWSLYPFIQENVLRI